MKFPISEHERRLFALYGRNPSNLRIQSPLPGKGVFVLFTNRSGSMYLASLLAQLPTIAMDQEVFNWDTVTKHTQQHGFQTFEEYVRFLRQRSPKPCWGAKMEYSQVNMLWRTGLLRAFEEGTFVVWIKRRGVVAQAVSYNVANHTKQWTSFQEQTQEPPAFDFDAILRLVDKIASGTAQAVTLLDTLGIRAESVWYEDLVEHPNRHIKQVADFVGEPFERVQVARSPFKKQEDPLKEDYEQRFLEEARRRWGLDDDALNAGGVALAALANAPRTPG
jgi:trehalose 2-sulfotransferase